MGFSHAPPCSVPGNTLWERFPTQAVVGPNPPDRWKEPRLFHRPFEEQFASRIVLERCSIPAALPERELSPNNAYWFALIRPDQTKNGPWDSDVLVFTERDTLLRIRLRDVLECHEIAWVNEKLLRIRVRWGRICATDLIVDVEREQIVYKEMVWDGVIPFQQFQEVKKQSQPGGAANGSQPSRVETNRTSGRLAPVADLCVRNESQPITRCVHRS